jgi:formylglycine-generating enzyme required for sulfatase activity
MATPVYVSHAEAEAYCRWKGKTLPTEAQYHRAAFGTPDGFERMFPWGSTLPQAQHGNFDFQPVVYRGPYEYNSPEVDEDYYPQTQPPPTDRPLVSEQMGH